MRKLSLVAAGVVVTALSITACQKSATDSAGTTSLTASATTVSVGQRVTVSANTSGNVVSWTVTPPTATSQVYSISTEKTNYFSFSQPGEYRIGVRARSMGLDSVHHCDHSDSIGHHVPDSIWNHHVDSLYHQHGFHHGGCHDGVDSASIIISVR
jgi:hypothetical protein